MIKTEKPVSVDPTISNREGETELRAKIRTSRVLLLEAPSGGDIALSLSGPLKTREELGATTLRILRLRGSANEMETGPELPPLSLETRAWIEAGDLYEQAIGLESQGAVFDMIVCLDPWAALTVTRGRLLWPQAQWICASDLARCQAGQDNEYWSATEEWIRSLPFHAFVPLGSLRPLLEEEIPESRRGAAEPPSPSPVDRLISAEKRPAPTSWRWKKIVARNGRESLPSSQEITLLIQYRSSVHHLRVLLDSLIRQDYPKERFKLRIWGSHAAPEVEEYLGFIKIAHPDLEFEWMAGSKEEGSRRRQPFENLLLRPEPDTLVFAPSGTVFPGDFLSAVIRLPKGEGIFKLPSSTLSRESAAHVLTGNLDPISHHGKLALADEKSETLATEELEEPVFVVPPQTLEGLDPELTRKWVSGLMGGLSTGLSGPFPAPVRSLAQPVLLRIPPHL